MKRHATDLVSLGFGAAFLAVAGIWLLTRQIQVSSPALALVAAIGLIVIGLVGVAAVLTRRHDDRGPQ